MVAEPTKAIEELKDKLEKQEEKLEELAINEEVKKKQIENLEKKVKELEELKDDFGDKLQVKLQNITIELNLADGRLKQHQEAINATFEGAKEEFASMRSDSQQKFDYMMNSLNELYSGAEAKLKEVDEMLKINGGSKSGNKRSGFLPDKMMVPKIFDGDVGTWRK